MVIAHPISVTCPVAHCKAKRDELCRGVPSRWNGEFKYRRTVHRERIQESRDENARRREAERSK